VPLVDKEYHIAIFASGNGSNAEKIIAYFQDHPSIHVSLILSNKPDAYVLKRAEEHIINCALFTKSQMEKDLGVSDVLASNNIDFIILAGFLLLIPPYLISNYPNRILNIHPSLLPKHGGKGMYGKHVHKSVKESGETKTGMTIHFVNEHYDQGTIIKQYSTSIAPEEDAEDIAAKVSILEHRHYPEVIEEVIELYDFSKNF